jgi:cytochrome c biogenesis protein CcmG, thiol:disulfide interchange protein DsbE
MRKVKVLMVFMIMTAILFSSLAKPLRGSNDYSVAEIELTSHKYLLKVNGQPIKLDVYPIWDSQSKNLLIPLRSFADVLGYEIKWDSSTHIATFQKDEIHFELHIQPKKIILKSNISILKYQTILKNSRLLLDSKTVGSLFRLKYILNPNNLIVTFYTDRSQIHMIAPDFNLKDIPGNNFNLYETLKNKNIKFVIINFYATRCPVCGKALPKIEQFYEDYKDKGVLVIGINTDTQNMEDQRDEVIKKYHLSYPILLDLDANIYSLYSVSGIPNLFVVNQNKEIVQHQLGVNDDYFNYLRVFIDKNIQK